MIKYIVYIVTISILIGCASFSKQSFRKEYDKLSKGNLSDLNGKYMLLPIKNFDNGFSNYESNIDLYSIIVNKPWKTERNKLDSLYYATKNYLVNLNLKDKTKLTVRLYENNNLLRDTILTGKLKKGMFYINNTKLDCHGIPYVLGGCSTNKRRIAISKQNNIIVNTAVDNTGAFLFVIGAGHSYNSTYEFEKIK